MLPFWSVLIISLFAWSAIQAETVLITGANLGITGVAVSVAVDLANTSALFLPSIWHPVDTISQWIAWLVVCLTVWALHFLSTRKPDAIVREEERKKKHTLAMSTRARTLTHDPRPPTHPLASAPARAQ